MKTKNILLLVFISTIGLAGMLLYVYRQHINISPFALFLSNEFYFSIIITTIRGLVGISLSCLAAIVISAICIRYKWVNRIFQPLLAFMRSIPNISMIMIAMFFLHPESIPLSFSFIMAFPLLAENLIKGLNNLCPKQKILAQQFRFDQYTRLSNIYYPQIKPFLFSGLASATGFGWRAIIMGEVLAQSSWGIGAQMNKAQTMSNITELVIWTIVAISISFLFEKGITKISNYSFPIRFSKINQNNKGINTKGLQLSLVDVSSEYAVSHFSYKFEAGMIYGISAPSGKGKTTLINLINGTLEPVSGDIEIDRTQGIASVFQEPILLPHLSVLENIILPLVQFHNKEEACCQASKVLSQLGMNEFKDYYPNALSYGQQQRVAMARALLYPSPYLVMDEPFRGLDEKLRIHIINYLRERQKKYKQTVLFTSHHAEELNQLADCVLYYAA